MAQMIFVNLPVADLAASRRFFTAIGYRFDERFCDDHAHCLEISDTIYAMLLRTDLFAEFTPRPVSDAHRATEALLGLSADSREEVDLLADRALAAGGTLIRAQEERTPDGRVFMYGRSYADLDGHIWEAFWMDPSAADD
jgi:predicted lactoylglutathione lyase